MGVLLSTGVENSTALDYLFRSLLQSFLQVVVFLFCEEWNF